VIEWDENGYPTEESLQRLREAVQQRDPGQALRALYLGLCEHAKHVGHCGLTECEVRGEVLRVWEYHTHGWSGNEAIINCLEESSIWHCLLERYDAGGHYYFSLNHASIELEEEMKRRCRERYGAGSRGKEVRRD